MHISTKLNCILTIRSGIYNCLFNYNDSICFFTHYVFLIIQVIRGSIIEELYLFLFPGLLGASWLKSKSFISTRQVDVMLTKYYAFAGWFWCLLPLIFQDIGTILGILVEANELKCLQFLAQIRTWFFSEKFHMLTRHAYVLWDFFLFNWIMAQSELCISCLCYTYWVVLYLCFTFRIILGSEHMDFWNTHVTDA